MKTPTRTITYSTILAGALALGTSGALHAQGSGASQPGASSGQAGSGMTTAPNVPSPLPSGSQQGMPQQHGGAAPGSQAGGNTTLGSPLQKPGVQTSGSQAAAGQPGTSGSQASGSQSSGAQSSGAQSSGAQSSGVPVTPQAIQMGENQIKSMLEAHGYTNVQGLQRDGSVYKVKEATRYGETVKDLRINASNGDIKDEKLLSENQIKQMLRDRKFSDISNLKRDGDAYQVKAKLNGKTYDLRINARAGTVMQQLASNS